MPTLAAESQSDSEVLVSDWSQWFEPREDDSEMVYEVVEITGETQDRYQVCWNGEDPKTRKPWPQSWLPKEDCANDLVLMWNSKRPKRKRTNSPTFQTSSRLMEAIPFEVDTYEKPTARKKVVSNPPRKKRRTTSNLEGPAGNPRTHGGKSLDVRNVGLNEEEDKSTKADDEEERIVEILLEAYHSGGMNDADDGSWNEDLKVDSRHGNRANGTPLMEDKWKARTLQEEEEDSDEVEVLKQSTTRRLPQAEEADSDQSSSPQPERHRSPGKFKPITKYLPDIISIQDSDEFTSRDSDEFNSGVILGPRAQRRLAIFDAEVLNASPRQPPPSIQPNASPRVHASRLKQPNARRAAPPPPPSWKKKQPAITAGSLSLGPDEFTRGVTLSPRARQRLEADSDQSLSPQPERHRKPKKFKPITKYLPDIISIQDSDEFTSRDSDEFNSGVILSPRAQRRLAIFDAEVLNASTRQPPPSIQPNASPRVHASRLKQPNARRAAPPPPPSWKKKQPAITAGSLSLGPDEFTRGVTLSPRARQRLEADSDQSLSPQPERHRKPKKFKPITKYLPDIISIQDSDEFTSRDSDESNSRVILSPRAQRRLAIFDAEVLNASPRQPPPSTQPNASPRVHASRLKQPNARRAAPPPPSWKKKQPVITAGSLTLGLKALNKTRQMVTTKKSKDSSDRSLRPEQSKPRMKHLCNAISVQDSKAG
jgi:hypothetical protein